MPKRIIVPDQNKPPLGISQGTQAGKIVFISGQVAFDDDGQLVGSEDPRAQADQCFKNIEGVVKSAGGTLSDITKITCFLASREYFPSYAAAREATFPQNPPASTTVIVSGLVKPELLVEVEATAVID